MVRMLRAFAWMRWRMLINSLEHTGSRDTLERFSIAIDKLGPIIAAVVMIPSALGLGAVGVFFGYTLGTAQEVPIVHGAVRVVLFAVPMLAIFGPLFLPAADRTNPIRLLLLPIPTSSLYVAQSSAAFGDPWTLLMVPLLAGVAAGLLVSGALTAALAALAAAVLLTLVVIGISSLATSVLHLVARDRRRGELLALLFIVVVPMIGMLPMLMEREGRRARASERESDVPAWVQEAGARALAIAPSELFVRASGAAATRDYRSSATALAGLAGTGLVLHALGMLAFRQVLGSPGSTGGRRAATGRVAWTWSIPGLSSGASAVAAAHLRLAMRTPRGRSTLLMPLAMIAFFGILVFRSDGMMEFGSNRYPGAISLAIFGSALGVLSILPIAMNQFAVDKAGLTMMLLSPLTEGELLAGKAVGNALIAGGPTLMGLIIVPMVFPPGPLWWWLTLVPALLSVFVLFAPVSAICSAIFPREVDMNSIGRASNAHSMAGLIGMGMFVVTILPPAGLTVLANVVLDRPMGAPLLVLAWLGIAALISKLLFAVARRTLAARRENLATI